MTAPLIIGTRGSRLALWQANWVKDALTALHPGLEIALEVIKTKGDRILDVPLAKVGGKGLFVKEIEEALLEGRVDLAVHSMKDMPAELPPGLCTGPIPLREDPRDVLITAGAESLARLPDGARIGTSSLRRSAQLLHARPDLAIVSLRGNLDTRLRKLETEGLDAIVLAAAGVKRLGLADRITEYLDDDVVLPAVAQGALCIELRRDDVRTREAVAGLDHPDTRDIVLAERAFLNRLGGSCQVPVAGHGRLQGDRFTLTGLVAELDGSRVFKETVSADRERATAAATALADRLLGSGAGRVMEKLLQETD
jgi:hydroxymethylbilane synthase